MDFKIVWGGYKNYLSIRDVHEKMRGDVINHMMEHYYTPHPLYKVLKMQEQPGMEKQYREYLRQVVLNECSIVAIDKKGDIHAVAMLMCMSKAWYSWTPTRLWATIPKFKEIMDARRNLVLQYEAKNPGQVQDCLHVFEYYIAEELRSDEEFQKSLFDAIYDTARNSKMPCVTLFALSMWEHDIALRMGYEELSRIVYTMYEVGNVRPFSRLRDLDENFGILFRKKVEPLVHYDLYKVRELRIEREDREAKEVERRNKGSVSKKGKNEPQKKDKPVDDD